jgi:hypothetical protein
MRSHGRASKRRGAEKKTKKLGPEKIATVALLKLKNLLIDLQWGLTNPSKADISKEALLLVINALRLCVYARENRLFAISSGLVMEKPNPKALS